MRIARAGRVAELQIVSTVDVRGPLERVDGVSLLVHVRAVRDRCALGVAFPASLLHLRQQTLQALRRRRSALAQQLRHALLRLPLRVR